MSKFDRIKNIIIGIAVIVISVYMLAVPSTGYYMATLILGVVLLINGIKQFIYFFSMGIHMIGGKMILYRALITMDLSFFILSIGGIGPRYMMVYFIIYYLFAGIIIIFRAYESRKAEAGFWKWKLMLGIVKVTVAIMCIIYNNSEDVMLYLLCFGLIISAVARIGVALKKTAIIYIQ
ncbi:MAG: DUF308 domain-containing protein [Acetatifactor sp.]